MKILHSSNHKLEEYKGHENSRSMNDETEEGAFSLNFYKFLEGKEEKQRKNTSLREVEPSHGGKSRRSRKVVILFWELHDQNEVSCYSIWLLLLVVREGFF